MTWIFGSFLVTPCGLASSHILITKQEDDSTIRALGYNRCVTGRRPRDENHAGRFRQSAENHSQVRDLQPVRSISDELARGCKRWHPLDPGRRYGKKKSALWVYVYPFISQLTTTEGPFENKVWEICCFFSFIEVLILSVDYVSAYICITAIQHYCIHENIKC